MINLPKNECWVCECRDNHIAKKANFTSISTKDFRITDSNYGVTAEIYQCDKCSFMFCPDTPDLLALYEGMEDQEYEETRQQRAIQLKHLLKHIPGSPNSRSLLDIGAGSGILVAEANKLGYKAIGVEPSACLSAKAGEYGLPVYKGHFPSTYITAKFDVITLIDVIEHVNNPHQILAAVYDQLNDQGVCLVVTPDVGSLASKIMKWKWWHFRLSHVGYFNKKTIELLCRRCGFETIKINRPGWVFPANYLFERVMRYFPKQLKLTPPTFLNKINIPLNLGDSMLLILRKE